MVLETEGVGGVYAGTALGLQNTTIMLGAFVSPPLGNSLAAINAGLPFAFWGGLCGISLLGFFFVKEPGDKKS